MRIVAVGDTHNKHQELLMPEGDIFIHCGDALCRGNDKEWRDFEAWFLALNYPRKFFVPGNHDRCCKSFHRPWMLTDHNLILDGIHFYFDAYQDRRDNWNFWNRHYGGGPLTAPDECDVLVTHIGPFDVLDQSHSFPYERIGQRRDFPVSKIHIFGHCHEGRGMVSIYGTDFYNVSSLSFDRNSLREPVIIELDSRFERKSKP